jgi:hypothetical protein
MITLNTFVGHIGRLTLSRSVDDQPIKQLDELSLLFRADSSVDFVTKKLSFKFDGLGNVNFFTQHPSIDLQRQFDDQDYILQFTLKAAGFEDKTLNVTVSQAHWDAVETDVYDLFGGKAASNRSTLLFDQQVSLIPKAVTAHVSVYRSDNEPLVAANFSVKIISPVESIASAVGSLAVWSFNPLPVASEVTVEVTDTSGETEVSSKLLTVDYSQPVNRWEIPVDVAVD